MFKAEETRHFELTAALNLYDVLLNHYRETRKKLKILAHDEEAKNSQLTDLKSLLLRAKAFIEERQEERGMWLESMRKELDSWNTERLVQELENRLSALDALPREAPDNEDLYSITLMELTQVIAKEQQYIIERVNELAERLKDEDSADARKMRIRMDINRSAATLHTEAELWKLLDEKRRAYAEEYWEIVEVFIAAAIKRLRQQQAGW